MKAGAVGVTSAAVGVAVVATVLAAGPASRESANSEQIHLSAIQAVGARLQTVKPALKPRIVWDPVTYDARRKKAMAGYARRHYGIRTWKLKHPRQIVLHYTAINSYSSIHNFFNDRTGLGPDGTKPESPGNCTHFVISKKGKIYQLAPLSYMCRATIGLNHVSIGIEFVELNSASRVLARPKQLRAGLRLVRWLQSLNGIKNSDVIGHRIANQSRFFIDNEGWKNDHIDWDLSQVRKFRTKL